jgi:hypothetical protein
MAGNVSLEFIGAQLERIFAELGTIRADQAAMRDDIKVLTTIVLRHDKTLTGTLTQMRAMVSQHSRFNDRLRRLEEQPTE